MNVARENSLQTICIANSARSSSNSSFVLEFLDFPPPLVEISQENSSSCFIPTSSAQANSICHLVHDDRDGNWSPESEHHLHDLQNHSIDSSTATSSSFSQFLHDRSLISSSPGVPVFYEQLPHYCQVEPLDESYLSLMEHPPLYVNYLTDTNQKMPLLGSSSSSQGLVMDQQPNAATTASNSKKRKADTFNNGKRSASLKREKVDLDLSPASSCCTTALNTDYKPRARQGTASDPQSIAARERRARISQRLKVLQDLVPNGSKVDLVTMLEKAINYVKFMQLQLEVLTTDAYWPQKRSRDNSHDHGQAAENSD